MILITKNGVRDDRVLFCFRDKAVSIYTVMLYIFLILKWQDWSDKNVYHFLSYTVYLEKC